jgi:hypothetical protein
VGRAAGRLGLIVQFVLTLMWIYTQLHFALLFCSYSKIKIKLMSGGMQFLTLNQGCTKFNLLVRHNIKYDNIISLHNTTLTSETMTECAVTVFGTKNEYCLDYTKEHY